MLNRLVLKIDPQALVHLVNAKNKKLASFMQSRPMEPCKRRRLRKLEQIGGAFTGETGACRPD